MAEVPLKLIINVTGDAAKSLDQIRNVLNQVEAEARKAAGAAGTVGARGARGLQRFEAGLRSVEARLKSVRASAQAMVGAGAQLAATGAVLTGAAIFPIKIAADFEKQMSKVEAVTTEVEDGFESMREEAKRLGRETAFTATQAAGGLELLGRAGLDSQEATQALEPTLLLAAAGALELSEAADIATNVLAGMGLEVPQLTRVTDVLTQTSINANVTISELGQAMSFAAPAAAAVGVEVETAAAAIGVLGDAGIKATRAGTALRGILTRLVDPTIQRKLKALGLQVVKTADGNIDLVKTFELIGVAVEQRTFGLAEATEIFGRNFATAAITIAGASDKLAELNQKNKEAEGTTKKVAEAMLKNLAGAATKLLSALEGLALQLGEPLLKPLAFMVKEIAKAVSALTEWAKEHKEFATGLVIVIGTIGGLMVILGTLAVAIGGTTLAISLMAGGVVKFLIKGAEFIGWLTAAKAGTLTLAGAVKILSLALIKLLALILIFILAWDIGRIISQFEILDQTIGQWVQRFFLFLERMSVKWALTILEMEKRAKDFIGIDTTKTQEEIDKLTVRLQALDKTKKIIKEFRTEVEKKTGIIFDPQGGADFIRQILGIKEEIFRTKSAISEAVDPATEKATDTMSRLTGETLKAGDAVIKIGDEIKTFNFSAEKSRDSVVKMADGTEQVVEGAKKITKEMAKVEEKTRTAVTFFREGKKVTIDDEDIDDALDKIADLVRPEEKIVTVKIVEERVEGAEGGEVLARGGRLSGYGGGDRIRALLEAGEYVVRKEAVKKYGAGFLNAVNQMSLRLSQLPQIVGARLGGMIPTPRFKYQTGGGVGSLTAENLGIVQLGVGERAFPVVSRVDTLTELKEALRRESLIRSN